MKQIEGVYEDSEPTGVWKSWHPDGELRKEQDFSGDDVAPDNRRPNSKNTDGGSEDFEIEPALEMLPTPNQIDSETSDSEAEAMEGISPLEFREPGTLDSTFDATDGSTDESQSDHRETDDILEGFFNDSDVN